MLHFNETNGSKRNADYVTILRLLFLFSSFFSLSFLLFLLGTLCGPRAPYLGSQDLHRARVPRLSQGCQTLAPALLVKIQEKI